MKKGFLYAMILSALFILPVYANANAGMSSQILFSGGSLHNPGIYKLNEETTHVERIMDGSSVDVSPDGKKLAFIKHDSLYIVGRDGKGQEQLTHSQFPVYDSSPRWSPDGKKIVFSRSDGNIYLIEVNSKKLTNLTQTDESIRNSEPDWSPDGSKIVFHSDRTGRSHIFVMNADGSNVRQLTGDEQNTTAEYSARFSPDGAKIVYGRTKEADSDIYIMNANGSNPKNLTPETEAATASPVWSNDGKKIIFISNENSSDTESILLTMNADGTGKAKIKVELGFVNPYAWEKVKIIENTSQEKSGFQSTLDYLSELFFD